MKIGDSGGRLSNPSILKEVYRSNDYLIKYFNTLTSVRQRWIGHKNCSDVVQVRAPDFAPNERLWAGYIIKPKTLDTIFETAFSSAGTALIVPSESRKATLLSRYPLCKENKNRVFTVNQCKGLEWDKAILFDFIADGSQEFLEMSKGDQNAEDSLFYRMVFNKYYVACTRSRENFIVVEDEDVDAVLKNNLFHGLPLLEENVHQYIDGSGSPESWTSSGNSLLEQGLYEAANDAFNRALKDGDFEPASKGLRASKIMLKKKEQRTLMNASELEKLGYLSKALELYESLGSKFDTMRLQLTLDLKHFELSDVKYMVFNGLLSEAEMNQLTERYALPLLEEICERQKAISTFEVFEKEE